MKLYPLKLSPVTKKILWGGTYLSENFNIGDKGESIAEAWVMTNRPDGVNVITNGEHEGLLLSDYIEKCKKADVMGDFSEFPLLIKLIDANDRLSVQVHPDDEYARQNGLDAGKTEMWYIVDAKPGAKLVYGLKGDSVPSYDELLQYSEKGNMDEILNYVDVKPGDCFYIPAGLVHAIGAGIVIAEIQQNSNTTYRLYDYDRRDKDGNKRELHIQRASETIKTTFGEKFTSNEVKFEGDGCTVTTLCDCTFFNVEKYTLSKGAKVQFNSGKMQNILCLSGSGSIVCGGESYGLSKSDSYLVPAKACDFSVVCESEDLEIIVSSAK